MGSLTGGGTWRTALSAAISDTGQSFPRKTTRHSTGRRAPIIVSMEIHEQRTADVVVLALVGRLTVSDKSGLLKDAVVRHLAAGARHILIDLADVVYIDSTRLGDLIATHITVAKQGGRLTLVRVPPRVASL